MHQLLEHINQNIKKINHFLTIHNSCLLLSHLLVYFDGLYCNQKYGPGSDCSVQSEFIVFVFIIKVFCSAFEFIQQISKQTTFQEKENWRDKG